MGSVHDLESLNFRYSYCIQHFKSSITKRYLFDILLGASKIIKFKYDIQPSHKKDIYESLVKHAIYDAQYKVKEYTKQLHMKVVGIESIDIKEPNEE